MKSSEGNKSVVYENDCSKTDTKYIGEGYRSAGQRLTEHQKASIKKMENSHLCKHFMTLRRQRSNCKECKVLATEECEIQRKFLNGAYVKLG